MSVPYSIFSLGDQAVSFEVSGDEIDPVVSETLLSMKKWIESNRFAGMTDVILGYRSIAITFDLFQTKLSGVEGSVADFVSRKLKQAYDASKESKHDALNRHVKIPVCYDRSFGLDIDTLCERNKITHHELIRLHSSVVYRVYLIGFLPGFPYLGFVDPRLEAPRHDSPRPVVPAGSVGIAGKQTGIYPFDSPGGWQIIGRTPSKLFDQSNVTPVVVEAGDSVTFYPIDKHEFDNLQNSTK